jgi:zinc transporter
MASPADATPLEHHYGSDKTGLVWGYRFTPATPGVPVDCEAALQPGPEGRFLWLHFSLSNAQAERWMGRNLALPQAFHDALHAGVASTRLEQDGDGLVAVLHDVALTFDFDVSDVSTVALALDARMLVSARIRPLRSLDRLRGAVVNGRTFRSPGELLAQLLREQAEVLAGIVRDTASRVDEIEDKVLARRIVASRAELGALRRSLVRLQRLLAPEPAAVFRLLARPPRWLPEEDVQDFRGAAEEFSAVVADSVGLVERVRLIQEELSALISEQTNRTLFVLTLVTVAALPINLVAGLMGMNVGGVPFSESANGFWSVVASLAGITGLLAFVALRRRRQ